MIQKTFSAETKVLDPVRGLVDCIFSVTAVKDRQGDIIEPGAFRKALAAKSSVPVVYGHSWTDLNAVLGKTVGWRELMPFDSSLPPNLQSKGYGGVKTAVQFDQETPSGRLAFQHVKAGNIKDWSFAFDSNKTLEKFDNDGTRRILEISEIFEVTLALIGANQEAMTLALKSMGMLRESPRDAWLPGVLAKAHESERRQADATMATHPLLAECASAVLLSLDNRIKTLLEYAETNLFDSYLPIAIHEAGHCVVMLHHGLHLTTMELHKNGNGFCEAPGTAKSFVGHAANYLAGLAAEDLWGIRTGKQLNATDAGPAMTLSAEERQAASQSAVDILNANHALVATLALALYRKAKAGDGVVSGSEIQDISQMVEHLKTLSLAKLQTVYHDLFNTRLGYPSWI